MIRLQAVSRRPRTVGAATIPTVDHLVGRAALRHLSDVEARRIAR